jgi:hypothetical protein
MALVRTNIMGTFLQNIGSYNSHKQPSQKMAFFTITVTSPIKESEKLPYPYN